MLRAPKVIPLKLMWSFTPPLACQWRGGGWPSERLSRNLPTVVETRTAKTADVWLILPIECMAMQTMRSDVSAASGGWLACRGVA